MSSPGRVRRRLGWLAVVAAALSALQLMVVPASVLGSAGIGGLFGIRAETEIAGGFPGLAMAALPSAVALVMWHATRSLPLSRERFALAALAGSVMGFLTFLPVLVMLF